MYVYLQLFKFQGATTQFVLPFIVGECPLNLMIRKVPLMRQYLVHYLNVQVRGHGPVLPTQPHVIIEIEIHLLQKDSFIFMNHVGVDALFYVGEDTC